MIGTRSAGVVQTEIGETLEIVGTRAAIAINALRVCRTLRITAASRCALAV